MVVIGTRSCDAFLSKWVCVCVVHIFSILLSVPERSEGTEVMKIAIRSDKCFGVAGMREKCFGVAGVVR